MTKFYVLVAGQKIISLEKAKVRVGHLALVVQNPVDMEDVTVYTASSVPAATSHPTLNSLQWTEDGQLLLVTKTAVHILVSTAL
jgi:hypothetical protein